MKLSKIVTSVLVISALSHSVYAEESKNTVVLSSEVKWEKLNPLRGDKSPQAATLWGDRKGTVPTGFRAKFVDGFSSPPHIHNVSYHAVVIDGLIHNDDPNATAMWMPKGSFWTQPQGEVHITAAKGSTSIALVEINKGPYLVLPTKEAFDNGERPINIDATNVVWVDHPNYSKNDNGIKVAYLWGSLEDTTSRGMFLKLPVGFSGTLNTQGSTFRAVVIQGSVDYATSKTLDAGSYFSSQGKSTHQLKVNEETILYIRTNAKFHVENK